MPARLSESASAAAAARAAGGESLPVTRAASVHEPSLNVTVAAGRGLTESESRPGSLAPQRPARAATVTVTAGDRDRAVGPLSDHGSDSLHPDLAANRGNTLTVPGPLGQSQASDRRRAAAKSSVSEPCLAGALAAPVGA
jgi:hypothetical protein